VSDVPALLLPVPSDAKLRERAEPPYRGVLGTALLQRRIVTFLPKQRLVRLMNGRRGRLPLAPEEMARATRIPFFLVGDGKVVFLADEGAVPALALLDTGAAASCVSARFARRAPPADGSAAHPLRLELGDRSVDFDASTVRSNLDERVSKRIGAEVSLLLGMDFVERFDRVVIDYVHQELLLVPQRATK
jgi:hypothetical protein